MAEPTIENIDYEVNGLDGIYEGGVVNGKPHGKGMWIEDCDEVKYDGDWANGVPHGYGKKTYANGTVEEGNWENGKFVG